MSIPITENHVELSDDEKLTPVMVYTSSRLSWGKVLTKKVIRVSTWLRTNYSPDSISLTDATSLWVTSSNTVKPLTCAHLHIPAQQILAFHLLPPHHDPLDYDEKEPNRILLPVTVLITGFCITAHLRISSSSNLTTYLDTTHENFTALYNAEIIHPGIPSLGKISVPYLLVRQSAAAFAE